MTTLSNAMRRMLTVLRDLKRGDRSFRVYQNSLTVHAVLGGMLEERGLARTVKHRDHTRSYVITAAGRAALEEPATDDERGLGYMQGCLAPVVERLDVPALCASVGYSAEPYGDAGALVTGTEADAVACARALRRMGWRVVRTGRILSVTP